MNDQNNQSDRIDVPEIDRIILTLGKDTASTINAMNEILPIMESAVFAIRKAVMVAGKALINSQRG